MDRDPPQVRLRSQGFHVQAQVNGYIPRIREDSQTILLLVDLDGAVGGYLSEVDPGAGGVEMGPEIDLSGR